MKSIGVGMVFTPGQIRFQHYLGFNVHEIPERQPIVDPSMA